MRHQPTDDQLKDAVVSIGTHSGSEMDKFA